MMKTLLLLCCLLPLLVLSGCASLGLTENFSETNAMIAQSNADRFRAFSEGMIGCGDDAACKVGLSMAFAGNIGNQQFYRPETALDWTRAIIPLAELGVDIYRVKHGGGSNNSGGITVVGDNNSGIGNTMQTSGDNSPLSASLSTSTSISTEIATRHYALGGDTSGGGTVTDPGVTVEPVVTTGTTDTTTTDPIPTL